MQRFLIPFIGIITCMSCGPEKIDSDVIIDKVIVSDTISSASGMTFVDNTIFIVGDDTPNLFLLSRNYSPIGKCLLMEGFSDQERIPKDIKPDFECMALWEQEEKSSILIFGSGSKPVKRDHLLIVNAKNPGNPEQYSLNGFYSYLLKITGITRKKINIEGAVIVQNYLYLFNRDNNDIYVTDINEFTSFVKEQQTDISVKIHKLELPEKNGVQASFSGAAHIPGTTNILFTASLEDTDNWISDGAIIGSYVGIIDVSQPEKLLNISPVTDKANRFCPNKIESITFKKFTEAGDAIAFAVVDNDDGTSKLLELQIFRRFFEYE